MVDLNFKNSKSSQLFGLIWLTHMVDLNSKNHKNQLIYKKS